jgi:hypothetical protein
MLEIGEKQLVLFSNALSRLFLHALALAEENRRIMEELLKELGMSSAEFRE